MFMKSHCYHYDRWGSRLHIAAVTANAFIKERHLNIIYSVLQASIGRTSVILIPTTPGISGG